MNKTHLLLIFCIFALLLMPYSRADVLPVAIKITNSSTGAVLSGQVNITVRIFDSASGGAQLWEENHTNRVPESDGNTYLVLGKNTSLDVSLTYEGNYLEFIINNGSALRPRTEMTSVASALQVNLSRPQTGFLPQSRIAGITIPVGNVTGQIDQSKISGITIPVSNVSGQIDQSRISGVTIPASNITGKDYSLVVSQANITGITIPFSNTTGQVDQSRIAGIAIPANNVTNGTFSALNYVFPENVTVNKLTATNLSGSILCSNIVGGSDSDYCSDASGSGSFAGVQGLLLGVNVTWTGLSGLTFGNNVTFSGISGLTLGTNVTWNGISGLTFGNNVTFSGISGLTLGTNVTWSGITGLAFGSNVTFSGITISAANVTNATFSTASGLVFTFPNNITVSGNLTASYVFGIVQQSQINGITIPFGNTTGQVDQSRISGITIPVGNVTGQIDQSRIAGITIPIANVTNLPSNLQCSAGQVVNNITINNSGVFLNCITDQTAAAGTTLPAANITNGTFSSSAGLVFTFPNNVSVSGNLTASYIFGVIQQSQINGITIPLTNASWNGVTGLTFGTNVTFNGISGLTFGNNVTFNGVTGLVFGTNVTFNGVTGLTFASNVTGDQLPQSRISGITIPANNVTNGTFASTNYVFPENVTVNKLTATNLSGSILCNQIVGGSDSDYCADASGSSFQGVQGLTLGVNVTWNGLSGLAFGSNVTFNGVTGLTFGNNVTFNGLTISAANVTNATFSSTNGLVFTFPNNVTITGNLSIDKLVSGWVPQSQISGITIPLTNASWNGVTGLTFANNITFNGLTGLTFTDNITGQLPQSRISGITIPAGNVTNQTAFSTATGLVFTFPNNVTVVGNLSASNLTGKILCNQIVGGSDSDYCADATGTGGAVTGTGTIGNIAKFIGANEIGDANITEDSAGNILINRNLSVTRNLTASWIFGNVSQSQITGITIPLVNASWNGVTGLAFGTNVTFNGVSGLTFGNNVTFSGVTGLTFGNNVTFNGVTISAANVTNATFSTANGLVFTFPNNLTVSGNLTASWITGVVSQSNINGITIPLVNASWNGVIISQSNITGITIPLVNASWNGVTGLAFGTNVTFSGVTGLTFGTNVTFNGLTGLTFTDNVTGQLPQSRIAGITIPAANVTNETFSTATGLVFFFPNNLTVRGNLTASNLTGNILCNQIVGGSDSDYCSDTSGSGFSGVQGLLLGVNVTWNGLSGLTFGNNVTFNGITISAANVTNATFGTGNYFFPNNVTVTGNLSIDRLVSGWVSQSQITGITIPLANASWNGITNLPLTNTTWNGITLSTANLSGFVSQSQISGITLPAANLSGFVAQSQISGITIPFGNTTGQVDQSRIAGITIPLVNTSWNGVTGLTFGSNVTFSGLTGLTLGTNVTWNGVTISQANITGITIPAGNVTSGGLGYGSFTFFGNVTLNATGTANNTNAYASYNVTLQASAANFTNATRLLNVTLTVIPTNGGYAHRFAIIVNQSEAFSLNDLGQMIANGALLYNLNASAISSGFVSQAFISGITIPAGNISGFITQGQINGITLPAANLSGFVSQSQVSGITIPLVNASWNGVTGLAFGTNVTFSGLSGLVLGTNVTWSGVTISQSNITGITIPAKNVTNGTFGAGNYFFPNNVSITGNLSIDRLTGGWVDQSQITGITIPLVNASWNGVTGLTFANNITFNGVTGLTFGTNVTFSGVTGLTFGSNVTFSGITGLTFANNVTGDQLPQSRISGITIPATNITNATFGTGNYVFPDNVTVTGNLSADNITISTAVNCLSIVGGSDSDYCADATGAGGGGGGPIPAANITGGVFGSSVSGAINYTFAGNVFFNATGNANSTNSYASYNVTLQSTAANFTNTTNVLNITLSNIANNSYGGTWDFRLGVFFNGTERFAVNDEGVLITGIVPQSQISGITIPLVNASWNGVTGLTFGTNITFNGVSSLTLGTNVTWNGLSGLTFGSNVTFNGVTGLTFANNVTGDQLPQSRISGITIPAANVTNATFSSSSGLVFTFPNNLTVTGNLSIDRLVSGWVPQSQITGITIPLVNASWNGVTGLTFGTNVTFGGVTGLTFGNNVTFSGLTISAANVTNATFSSASGLVFTFPNNLTVTGNLSIDRLSGGWIDQSRIAGITIPLANASWNGVSGLAFGTNVTFNGLTGLTFGNNVTFNGVTGLAFGTNVTFSGVTGLTFGNNVTFSGVTGLTFGTNVTFSGLTGLTFTDNITGQLPQSRISGITIPAGNVTNQTAFSTAAGLVFTFPNNVTVVGNLSASNLTGKILCSQIVGGSDSDYCADATGAGGSVSGTGTIGSIAKFTGANEMGDANITEDSAGNIVVNRNLTVTRNLTASWIFGIVQQSQINGITIPLVNASWNGVTGLVFGTNVTFNGVSGLTFANNVTGDQLPQSRISGITIPASNVTNATFGAGNYFFPKNVSVTGNLTIDNLTTGSSVNCLSIVGGSDSDFCADATGAGGGADPLALNQSGINRTVSLNLSSATNEARLYIPNGNYYVYHLVGFISNVSAATTIEIFFDGDNQTNYRVQRLTNATNSGAVSQRNVTLEAATFQRGRFIELRIARENYPGAFAMGQYIETLSSNTTAALTFIQGSFAWVNSTAARDGVQEIKIRTTLGSMAAGSWFFVRGETI